MSGRPLRFLGGVVGGWIVLRVVLLLPAVPPLPPLPVRIAGAPKPPVQPVALAAFAAPVAVIKAPLLRSLPAMVAPIWHPSPGDPRRVALALLELTRVGEAEPIEAASEAPTALEPQAAAPPFSPVLLPPGASRNRWHGAIWLVGREGQGLGGPYGGQLGGSQAGARITYALDKTGRLAVAARIASPIGTRGAEGAIGLEYQPTRLPVRVVAEQRIAIDPGGGGPAVGVVGGVGPVAIHGFRLEAYGQAGVIGRGGGIGYADGAVRVERRVAGRGQVELAAGAGAWGAVQPGAARLDVGPTMGVTVPFGDQKLRLSLEWRERIGGRAAPGSGPAITLGADF